MAGTVKQLYGTPWSESDFIVALHYYFLNHEKPRHETSGYILELARLLGRTPASVVMRMENFESLDHDGNPERKGLGKGGPSCRRVFLDWEKRRDALHSCAAVLIRQKQPNDTMSLFEAEHIELPKAFNRYELLDRVGDGGSGTVFSCLNTETGVRYAIKIIKTENRYDRETMHRFAREMRILASIRHDSVIHLHERNLDAEERFPAFVMDYADCSLTQYMQLMVEQDGEKRPCLERSEALSIFTSIAAGTCALHEHSVIHRDINPNNILRLPTGNWVLSDFGLAKYLPAAASVTTFVTSTHMGWGTAYYAAPEQYRDFKRTDARTDIYALGMLLWELFSTAWPAPDSRNPGLPDELELVFQRCTAREPDQRFQGVSEMLNTLESATAQWRAESDGPR